MPVDVVPGDDFVGSLEVGVGGDGLSGSPVRRQPTDETTPRSTTIRASCFMRVFSFGAWEDHPEAYDPFELRVP